MVSICSLSLSTSTNFRCFFPECLQLIGQDVGEKGTSKESSFNQVIRIKAVHFLAFFVLFYVGVEVTIGGKIYAICFCDLSPKKLRLGCHFYAWCPWRWSYNRLYLFRLLRGYVLLSEFHVYSLVKGLMLGRVLLLWVNKKVHYPTPIPFSIS